MNKKELFSVEEMSVMEALEVRGGAAESSDVTQIGCPNNVAGCACDIIIESDPIPGGPIFTGR